VFWNVFLIVFFVLLAAGVCIGFKIKLPEVFVPVLVWEVLNVAIAVAIFGPWGPWGILG